MLAQKIKDKAIELGYLACGIIPAGSFDEYIKALDDRVKTFPESKELYKYFYEFSKQPPNAKSVIVCTQRFNNYKPMESLEGIVAKCYQFDCRMDYAYEHRAKVEFNTYLETLGISVLDDITVPDRWAAVKAGLGKFGRNNFVYDPEHGSNIWIETWVVDKELEYDVINEETLMADCVRGCNKCITSCPTKALSGELTMDMGKCITYLFCSDKETSDLDLMEKMQQWVYGCDVCQDVCPHNHNKYNEAQEFPLLADHARYLSLEGILEMDEDVYKNIVNKRFWYVGEDGLWLWKFNALRAMINSEDEKYYGYIEEYCNHENLQIRELAKWGWNKIKSNSL